MKPQLDKLKEERIFVVYDFETTGTDPAKDRPIELAAIRYALRNGKYVPDDVMKVYINADVPISEGAMKVHGITPEKLLDLSGGRTEADAFPEIEEFFGFGVIPVVGYNNRRFDDLFMKGLFERNGKEFAPALSLDVFTMVKDWLPNEYTGRRTLSAVAEYYGAAPGDGDFEGLGFRDGDPGGIGFHDAAYDAVATKKLFMKLAPGYYRVPVAADKEKARVTAVRYWEKNHSMRRLYVQTDMGSCFYDLSRHSWSNADINMDAVDMEDVARQARMIAGAETDDEFERYRPDAGSAA